MKKISLHDVKSALLDGRFRDNLPDSLSTDVKKFLENPGCACNHPIYKKVMQQAKKQLSEYYPTKMPTDPEELEAKASRNQWTVINCHIDELRDRLERLGPGRKQLDIARWQDQVTIVINELDII
jgi:hypothetical protein